MAVKGRGRTEACINHPGRAAVTRCAACHKPICGECVVSTSDGKFCSRDCAARTADFRKAQGKMAKKAGKGVMGWVKAVVGLAILIIVLWFAHKIFIKKEKPAELLDRAKEKLSSTVEEAREKAQDAKEKAEEAVD